MKRALVVLAALAACGSGSNNSPADPCSDAGGGLTVPAACIAVNNAFDTNPSCVDAGLMLEADACVLVFGLDAGGVCNLTQEICADGVNAYAQLIAGQACAQAEEVQGAFQCVEAQ